LALYHFGEAFDREWAIDLAKPGNGGDYLVAGPARL
jgi:hypothetical protein